MSGRALAIAMAALGFAGSANADTCTPVWSTSDDADSITTCCLNGVSYDCTSEFACLSGKDGDYYQSDAYSSDERYCAGLEMGSETSWVRAFSSDMYCGNAEYDRSTAQTCYVYGDDYDGTNWYSGGLSESCGCSRRRLGALRGADSATTKGGPRNAADVAKTRAEDAAADSLVASNMVDMLDEITALEPKHNRRLLSDTIITITASSSLLTDSDTGYSYDTRDATLDTTVFCDSCESTNDDGTCESSSTKKCLNGVYFDNSVGVCGFHLVSGSYRGCCDGTPYNPNSEGCCMTSPDVYEVISTNSGNGAGQQCFCSTCVDDPTPEPTPAPSPLPTLSTLPTPSPSPVPTPSPSPVPTSVPTVLPTTPAPSPQPTELWTGTFYMRYMTWVIGGSFIIGVAIVIRCCFHKWCIKTYNCLTCQHKKNKTAKPWDDMTPEEAEEKAKRDMEREIRKQEAKALQMKQFKSNPDLTAGATSNPLTGGGGSRAPGAQQKHHSQKKEDSGEFDFEIGNDDRESSYVGFEDTYDMNADQDSGEAAQSAKSKKNPFNRDRRNSSEQRSQDGVHQF